MALTHWPEIGATSARLRGTDLEQAWGDFLGGVPWELFVTLTFDPKRWRSVDRNLAVKEATWWCYQVGRLTRRPVAWLIAPERHQSGSWHSHVLLVGLPPAGLGGAPEAMWKQRCGRIDVRNVYAGRQVVVYATKSAALAACVELSDTLKRYRPAVNAAVGVALYPCKAAA
jgi:hypothetical protein